MEYTWYSPDVKFGFLGLKGHGGSKQTADSIYNQRHNLGHGCYSGRRRGCSMTQIAVEDGRRLGQVDLAINLAKCRLLPCVCQTPSIF